MAKAQKSTNIDGYISQFTADMRAVLRDVRETIRRASPVAEETISYRMPTFRRHGILVYFAAWKQHIGMYPPISGDKAVEQAIAATPGRRGISSSRSMNRCPLP